MEYWARKGKPYYKQSDRVAFILGRCDWCDYAMLASPLAESDSTGAAQLILKMIAVKARITRAGPSINMCLRVAML